MALYHVMLEPKPGRDPALLGEPPLSPCDFAADSQEDALAQFASKTNEYVGEILEVTLFTANPATIARAEAAAAYVDDWAPAVRQVDRPAVDVQPRYTARDAVHDGRVVGTRYDYGAATGEQSFDVLLNNVVHSRLDQAFIGRNPTPGDTGRVWRLTVASERLAFLIGREWADTHMSLDDGLAWPDEALYGIRAALEA